MSVPVRGAKTRREFCRALAGATAGAMALPFGRAFADKTAAKRPNILFVFADDLGWSDLGCYGSEYYETPNIDRLAAEGMRFTDAYVNAPVCSPSRAAFLTGQYAPRTGCYAVGKTIGWGKGTQAMRKLDPVDSTKLIDPDKTLIAAPLKAAGYKTGCHGKWHNGNYREYHPKQRGFDEGWTFVKEHTQARFGPFNTRPETECPPGKYMADFVTDNAIDFIERNREAPFFLYLPYFAVHATQRKPAPPDNEAMIEKYESKPPHNGDDNAEFAAMIENLDANVGRILRRVDELGLRDDTLVVFFSDNGGQGGFADMGLRGANEWTSNAPLKGGKGTVCEGGLRVPLIVRWPGRVKPGTTCREPVSSVDFFPTFCEIAGARKPDQPLDGVSLAPLLASGGAASLDRCIFWHLPVYYGDRAGWGGWKAEPCSLVRCGDYKLIEYYEDGRVELYNLRKDIGETKDLAAAMPDKAAELKAKLDAWKRDINAPIPKPKTEDKSDENETDDDDD